MEKTAVSIAHESYPTNDSPFLDGSPQMRAIRTVIESIADARILKVSYKTLLTKISECGLTAPSRR